MPGNGWGHGDPPGVVRIGCLGDVSWKVVQRIAEATKGVVEPVCHKPDKHSVVKEVEPLIEPEEDENGNHYLPPEYIRMTDRKDFAWRLFADEDTIWHEPSKHTISLLRRLLER